MRIPRGNTCGRALIPQAGSHAWLLCGYLGMQSAVNASAAGLVRMLTYGMRIPMERHVTCSGIWYAQARPLMQPAALSVSSALQAQTFSGGSRARGSRHRQGGGTHHSMLRQKWQHRHLASHLVQRGVFCIGNQRSRGTRSFAKHQSQKHPVQSPQSTQVRRSISSSPPMAWDSG